MTRTNDNTCDSCFYEIEQGKEFILRYDNFNYQFCSDECRNGWKDEFITEYNYN